MVVPTQPKGSVGCIGLSPVQPSSPIGPDLQGFSTSGAHSVRGGRPRRSCWLQIFEGALGLSTGFGASIPVLSASHVSVATGQPHAFPPRFVKEKGLLEYISPSMSKALHVSTVEPSATVAPKFD